MILLIRLFSTMFLLKAMNCSASQILFSSTSSLRIKKLGSYSLTTSYYSRDEYVLPPCIHRTPTHDRTVVAELSTTHPLHVPLPWKHMILIINYIIIFVLWWKAGLPPVAYMYYVYSCTGSAIPNTFPSDRPRVLRSYITLDTTYSPRHFPHYSIPFLFLPSPNHDVIIMK